MNAAFIQEPGPPEVIQYGSFPEPSPASGQILIQTEAVSINPIDTYIRAGKIPMEIPKPYVPATFRRHISDGTGIFETLKLAVIWWEYG
jgi:NADPH:quinone reductase-like Zn-dependent oxidoreductase